MANRLLAIDPAVRSSGWAIYTDRTLTACGSVQVPRTPGKRLADGVDVRAMVMALYKVLGKPGPYDHICYEWPQIYSRGKVDPNDLLAVAAIGAGIASILPCHKVSSPTPRQWSGGQSKTKKGPAWDSPRAQRCWRALSESERSLVRAQHDEIDAVSIGLWALGRFAPHRVLPGAT